MRAIHLVCFVVVCFVVAGCSVDPPDLDAKSCPCVGGFSCSVESKQCFQAMAAPAPGLGCVVYTDGKLYCPNTSEIDLHRDPSTSSDVVNRLLTTYSWFLCWGVGEPHERGNTTWYFTDGDIRGAPNGWLPSVHVSTSSAFDADPASYGFARCP